jgi:ATP-binding cassette subfamily B protein
VQQPVDAPALLGIERLLDRMPLAPRRRARARTALLMERVKLARFRGCWLLRLPTGSTLRTESKEIRLRSNLLRLTTAHFLQYGLFLLSWWLLGRGVLNGTIDRGWLLGWTLLLLSLIPLRLFASWTQGVTSTTVGAWLRRRLLRGALGIDREHLRQQGIGQHFGLVVESAAIESLAWSGGISAVFSLVELVLAMAVLWTGASVLPGVLLALSGAVLVVLGLQYLRERRLWTKDRVALTDQLLDSMVGHRTRLAQQPVEQWHPSEDVALTRYIQQSCAMDRSALRLTAFVPRAWMVVALAALIPTIASQPEPGRLAISMGGILLAHRSLRRIAAGLSNLAGALVAGEALRALVAAAPRRDLTASPSAAVRLHNSGNGLPESPALHARDIVFRYPKQVDPVLHGCTLSVPHGSRLLLEGASGAGKSTLAAILAGLQTPDGGLVLADGLDRSVVGKSGWRRRVVLAPQAHDNFLIGGSLAFNLLMGRAWPPQAADLSEAETICRELGLGDLLERLPGGLHQMVGETGWQLSQGERTRVFLARALLQDPDVLILDEALGALDPENVDRASRCVQKRARTVLAIAHA